MALLAKEAELRRLKEVKLQRLREENALQRYRLQPTLWLQERLGEDPRALLWALYPGYEAHTWDGDVNPLHAAWVALCRREWAALLSATSTGKTYTLARIVYWFLDCYRNSLVVTSAPKQDQLSLQLWPEIERAFPKFQRIRPHARITKSLRLYVDARGVDQTNEGNSWMAVGFVAGVKADEASTTRAQGFHREHMLIITEETPGMPQPTLTAFQNTCTANNNLILAVGNPDAVTDTLCQFADTAGKVITVRASAYDHPNVVTGREIIPGAVSQASINWRRVKYGEESGFYQSRVRGIAPAQAADSLIQYAWVTQCWIQRPEYEQGGGVEEQTEALAAVGVDVANSENGDKASLAWGRTNVLRYLQTFTCPNATDLAYNLLLDGGELARRGMLDYRTPVLTDYGVEPSQVGVDTVGVGVATVNGFLLERLTVTALQSGGGQLTDALPVDKEGKPLYQFINLRAQMWFELREDLRQKSVAFDIADKQLGTQLAKELTLPRFRIQGGKIAIEKKEEIKKRNGGQSPNLGDAVVYWNWVRKGYYRRLSQPLPMGTGRLKAGRMPT